MRAPESGAAALRQARPADATREFVRILQLHARYDAATIAPALEHALALRCWSADGVEQCAIQLRLPSAPTVAVDLTVIPALTRIAIPLPDLRRFAALLPEVSP